MESQKAEQLATNLNAMKKSFFNLLKVTIKDYHAVRARWLGMDEFMHIPLPYHKAPKWPQEISPSHSHTTRPQVAPGSKPTCVCPGGLPLCALTTSLAVASGLAQPS